MIVARISSQGRPDRFVDLHPGRRSFGSDLGCDVVLIEDAVDAVHFVLDIGADGVFLEMAEGCTGGFHPGSGRRKALGSDERLFWGPAASLEVGALIIQIKGEECRARPSRLNKILAAVMVQSGRMLKVSAVVLVSVVVVTVTADVLLRSITSPQDPQAAVATPVPGLADLLTPGVADLLGDGSEPITAERVREDLARAGFEPSTIDASGDGWSIVVHLTTEAEREPLAKALADLDYRVESRVFLDTTLRTASRLVLQNVDGQAQISEIDRGRLVLTLIEGDAKIRQAMRDTLLTDVPGLREVRFIDGPESVTLTSLHAEILAIWGGKRPYVALRDGRHVREGQALATDITLIAVEAADRLILEVDGNQREFTLQ
ncbi:MAG: hypothetical protein AAF183_20065 [Pseudomonadota bacterium]